MCLFMQQSTYARGDRALAGAGEPGAAFKKILNVESVNLSCTSASYASMHQLLHQYLAQSVRCALVG
jgi:hypothetical protein